MKFPAKLTYGVLIGSALASSTALWLYWKDRAYTDDAYVQGNQIMITPLHAGFVQKILTDDTYLAKKGQLLLELDATDAQIAFESASQALASKVREICQAFHEAFARQAEVQSRQALYIKAIQDYEHRFHVLDAGGVSLEDFEHAQAELRTAFSQLQMSQILLEKSLALIKGTCIAEHPQVVAAKDLVRQTFVDLYRCKIYAPADGLVAQRNIQVGMWVPAGQPLMSIIPLDQIWVNANFKETQMKRMRIGQSVKITSDLYGDNVVFHGKILGLPGGAGNAFSILPPQNLSGNWIKIVQRLPVRVGLELEEIAAHPLRIGLSLEATVDLKEQGALVPSSSTGSPTYSTDIFEQEERGDLAQIQKILKQNLDDSLEPYWFKPLVLGE